MAVNIQSIKLNNLIFEYVFKDAKINLFLYV